MRRLERRSRPDLIHIGARNLRPLGTDFSRVTISTPYYKIEHSYQDNGKRLEAYEPPVPAMAAISEIVPRIQEAAMHLSRHMCRHLGPLRPRQPEKWDGPDIDDFREYSGWEVSEHRMHDCDEFEETGKSKMDKWYRQWDWLDEETEEWFGETEEVSGKRPQKLPGLQSLQLSKTGLRSWIMNASCYTEEGVTSLGPLKFTLDAHPRRGTKSWFCEDTAQLVWIEDEEKVITGYVQIGKKRDQQSLLIPPYEPPMRPSPYTVCCFGAINDRAGILLLPKDENGEDRLERERRLRAEESAAAEHQADQAIEPVQETRDPPVRVIPRSIPADLSTC